MGFSRHESRAVITVGSRTARTAVSALMTATVGQVIGARWTVARYCASAQSGLASAGIERPNTKLTGARQGFRLTARLGLAATPAQRREQSQADPQGWAPSLSLRSGRKGER
jgi:hypothetical protein